MREIDLVIFDFDGVIMDTEWAHAEAKRKICVERKYLLREELDWSVGRSNKEFWERVLLDNRKCDDLEELVRQQFEIAWELLRERGQQESEGLTVLLRELRSRGKQIAICSGSQRGFILRILEYLKVTSFFTCIVGAEDARELKPAPDLYLRVLEKAQMTADRAVVVEDSASGCQAAKSAGIYCIGYLNRGENSQNLGKADVLVGELRELLSLVS